jgi:hypothetical protein
MAGFLRGEDSVFQGHDKMDILPFLYLDLFTDVHGVWRPIMGIVNQE